MALTHGFVVGELVRSTGRDGPDPDKTPDIVPATGVKVTFSPAVKQFVSPTGRLVVSDDAPAAVMSDGQITGDLESDGTIKEGATAGLWLVQGTYTVKTPGHYSDFKITVTDAHTEATPLVLGEAISAGPSPTVTLQTVALPQGAAEGQVLGWDGGLAWVTGGAPSDAGVAAMVQDPNSDTRAAILALVPEGGDGGLVEDPDNPGLYLIGA